MSAQRFFQAGFIDSISATFFSRRQALICFSRAIELQNLRVPLVVNKFNAVVSGGEAGDELVSVLGHSFHEVIGRADVQRPRGATHDVDVVVARHSARGEA